MLAGRQPLLEGQARPAPLRCTADEGTTLMPMVRTLHVLQTDVPFPKALRPKGKNLDIPDEFEKDDLFVHETITPAHGGRVSKDQLVWIDDDDLPAVQWPKGSKMYDAIMPHLQRAKPCVTRILQEYDAYLPESVAKILLAVVDQGLITLKQLEKVVIRYRREMDFDMQDEDDTIILPGEADADDTAAELADAADNVSDAADAEVQAEVEPKPAEDAEPKAE